jgi:RNA polymerase sigma-70 factor (ECF subfamily)
MWFLPLVLGVLEDTALAVRLQGQDPAAFEELYDQYSGMLFGILLRIAGNRGTAEELLQEVFLRVWERAGTFSPQKGSLSTWMIAMARNRGIDYRRSVEGRMELQRTDLEAMEPPHQGRAEESVVQHLDEVVKVRIALASLTVSQRRVIELAYYEGLSNTEIATRLGQPLGTVKALLRRGLTVLRESYTERPTG